MTIRLLWIVVMMGASPAWCEIYRWTDADGRVHFGDRPRVEQAERVEIRQTPAPAPSVESPVPPEAQQEQQRRLIDALREEREARELKHRQAEENEARRSQRCAYARNRLKRYRGSRLYQPQEDGGRHYLNEQERQEELTRAGAEVERWCGP
jgi:hypothetical protein